MRTGCLPAILILGRSARHYMHKMTACHSYTQSVCLSLICILRFIYIIMEPEKRINCRGDAAYRFISKLLRTVGSFFAVILMEILQQKDNRRFHLQGRIPRLYQKLNDSRKKSCYSGFDEKAGDRRKGKTR